MPNPGEKIGPYQLVKPLGKGGIGEVFLATQDTRAYALKFLKPGLDPLALSLFHREVRWLSQLSHPNLVRILDFFGPERSAYPQPFFVMEYLEGTTLEEGLPASANIEGLFLQASLALHFLHSKGVLHRDLKPSNLFVTKKGRLKVLDFSLSIPREEGQGAAQAAGTYSFMAPETFAGQFSERSDLFALGAVFFKLLSGRRPYLKALFSEEGEKLPAPPPLRSLFPEIPEYFSNLISQLLEKNPAQRPSSAWTLLKYLALHSEAARQRLEDPQAGLRPEQLPLIGREQETKLCLDFFSKPPKGLRTLFLRGPSGVGCSRFLEEMRWKFLLQGGQVAVLGPEETGALELQLAASLGKALGEKAISAAQELAAQLADGGESRYWIFLKDLDRWSPERLEALTRLLQYFSARRLPMDFIWEIEQGSNRLDPWLAGAKPLLSDSLELELFDLSTADCERLIHQLDLLSQLSQKQIHLIAHSAGGRPLLAIEAARVCLEHPAGDFETQLSLPTNLQQAYAAKLNGLNESEKSCLALLLVGNLPITPDRLCEINPHTRAALPELFHAALVEPPEGDDAILRLQHPSLKSLLRSLIEASAIGEAHRRWQQWAEARLAANPDDAEALLIAVQHAVELGDDKILARWGFRALFVLEARHEFAKALEWSSRFLELSPQEIDHCALHAFRAPIFFRLARYPEALDSYRRWYELRADDESRLQEVKFHYYCGLVHSATQARAEADEALRKCLVAGDPKKYPSVAPYQARALEILSSLEGLAGKWESAWELLNQAASLGLQDPLLEARINLRRGEIALKTLRLSEARRCLNGAREEFLRSPRPSDAMLADNALAILEKERGELRAALAHCEAALRGAEQSGEHGAWARYLSNRGLILAELGRVAEAREAARQAKGFLKIYASEQEVGTAEIQEAELLYYCGNLDRCAAACQGLLAKKAALKLHGLWNYSLLLRAKVAVWQEDLTTAEAILEGLDVSQALSPSEKWLCATLKLQALHRRRALVTEDLELFPKIPESPGEFRLEGDWPRLFEFLCRPPGDHSKESFYQILEEILSSQSPFLRLQQLLHLQVYFLRHGLQNFISFLQEHRTAQWKELLNSLPEEIRMDFQKNMNLIDADQAMKAPVNPAPSPGSSAEPRPKEAVGGPPASASSVSEEKFRQFCEISNQLAHKSELREILEGAMDAAILLTGAERGFLILKGGGAEGSVVPGFEIRVARHLNPNSLQSKDFDFSWTVVKRVLSDGSPVLTQNALEEEGFRELNSVHSLKLRSIMALPLESQGKILGVIYLDNRFQIGSFQPADLSILMGFANQASAAIVKQQMLEDLRQAKTQLESKVQVQEQRIEVLSEELSQSRDQLKYEYRDIIGSSPAMMKIFKLLDHVSKTKIPVWIFGESGTGKELIARSLHENSPRKKMPFISENCGSIPENLLESELFGHKKGSFTHADRDRVGLFEQANGGTLFLDEVADMSLGMQVKLLRVLQEEEVRPVGSNKKVPVDVRLVTASNRDLAELVEKGSFREDLFYRINGMTIHLPPLRERREDIPALIHHLMKRISKSFQLEPCKVSQEALDFLMGQEWPGNIRQLEGVLRNAMMFADGKLLSGKMLKANSLLQTRRRGPAAPSSPVASATGPGRALSAPDEEDKRRLLECLRRHNLDKNLVAEELGITPKTVYMRLAKYGIPKKNSLLMKYLNAEK